MAEEELKKDGTDGTPAPAEGAPAPQPAEAPATPTVSERELAELRRKAEESDQLMNRLKRVTADYMNSTKRLERQMQERSAYAIESFARDLLPVADDLARALAAVRNGAPADKVREGIELVEKQLFRAFERHGITVVETKPGDPFDTAVHDAVTVVETNQQEANRIVEAAQKGFRLHGRLLRPARVVVSAPPRTVQESEKEKSNADV